MNDVLTQLLRYSAEANRRFIETIRLAQPESERIATIFCHILNAHRIWNARLAGTSPAGGVWDVYPIEQWPGINQENCDRSLEIVKQEPLERLVDYIDTKGNPYRNSIRDILLHVVNHSTYHRGQLAILLGQEQKPPPVTDYIAFAREAK